MKKLSIQSIEFKQFLKKYELCYSPRTTFLKEVEIDVMYKNQLIKYFDPFTVNFLKREFEVNQGRVNKVQVIIYPPSYYV